MQVTLREMLTAKMFSSSKVLAGSEGLSNQVTSMCILADQNGLHYLKEHTLAIVCGMFLAMSAEEYADYMRKIAKKDVAGLLIKAWYYRPETLDVIRKTGNELKMPIITIENNDYAFSDFYAFADSNIYCRGEGVFLSHGQVDASLSQAMYNGGLPELCGQLNTWTGLTVVWLSAGETRCFPPGMTGRANLCGLTDSECKKRAASSSSFAELVQLNLDSGSAALGVALSFRDKAIGYIWVEPSTRAPDENDAQLLRAVKLVCELEMRQVLLYEQETAKMKEQFVKSLLSGKVATYSEAELVSSGLGWRIPPQLQVLCAECTDDPEINPQMDAVLSDAVREWKEHIVIQPYEGHLAVLLPCGKDQRPQALFTALKSRWAQHKFSLGVGRQAPFQQAHKSYAEAEYAMSNGNLLSAAPVVYFAKMGYLRLFLPTVLPGELVVFCRENLLPLMESDRNVNLDLLNTIQAYYRAQGNYKLAGEELFVHPNTVRYRMQVIEEICGISFKNEHEMLNMRLALQLMPKAFPDHVAKPR